MAISYVSVTEAGSGSASTTHVINVPGSIADGDLLLLFASIADGDTSAINTPSGWTEIVDNLNTGGSAPSPPGMSVFWRIASSEPASYTLTQTDTAATGWVANMIAFRGVDQTTPIDVATVTGTGDGANANASAISYSDSDAAIVIGVTWDATSSVYTTVPSGYANPSAIANTLGTGGGNGCEMATAYDLTPGASPEDPPGWTSGAEQWCTATVALRAAITAGITTVDSAYGVGSDELDFDDADVDINGANFEASQGTGAVYLSDASTLAGSANEVDISSAINTWADALINLDFTALSAGEVSSLHTLGPGARYIIVTNDSADEYSIAVALHRPNAVEMVLSANFAPGSTTQRLTGLTGTFAGGRIEEALNPSTTTTDVASNGNREDVWNIQLTPSAREVSYDFRVLYGGAVPDTITQTPQVTGASGGTDQIAGAASLDFTPSSTIQGRGQLAGAGTIDFAPSATIAGFGRLAGTATVDFTPSATIKGRSLLAGIGTIDFSTAGVLKGLGRIVGAESLTFTSSSTARARGRLTGAGALDFTASGIISNVGSVTDQIAGTASLDFTSSASIQGRWQLTGAGAIDFTPTAAIRALGRLVGAGALTFTSSGIISGKSQIAGAASFDFTSAGALRARGRLVGGANLDFSPVGNIAGKVQLAGNASLDFAPVGVLRRRPRVWINTVASKNGSEVELPWSVWNATSITFQDTLGAPTGAVYIGIETPGLALAWSILQNVSTTGTDRIAGEASLDFAPSSTIRARGRLVGSEAFDFTASATARARGLLAGAASLDFAPSAGIRATGRLVGSESLNFTPTAAPRGYGRLSGTATIDFTSSGIIDDASNNAIAGAASIVFTATSTPRGRLRGAGVATIDFTPVGAIVGKSSLSGVATLDFSPSATLSNKARMSGAATLDFSPSAIVRATGRMSGTATIDFGISARFEVPVYRLRHIGPTIHEFFA